MSALFGAGLAGLATFLLSIPSYLRAKTDERSPFWRPQGPHAARKLAKRAKIALSRRGFLYAWILFVPSLVGLGVVTVLSLGSNGSALAPWLRLGIIGSYAAGIGLAFGISAVFGLRKAIRQGLLAVATQAGKAIARRGALDDAERILVTAAQASPQHLRLAAAIALRYLGTTNGNAALERLGADPDDAVRKAAHSSLQNIQAVLSGEQRESVMALEKVAIEFQQLDAQLDLVVDNFHRSRLLGEYNHLSEVLEGVIYAQLPLRRSYPYLFCMDCRCRAEQLVFKDWAWVRCKRCLDVFGLKPAIVEVTGQIGGVQGWELRNGELKLSLWDLEERKARGAEIDILEIIGGQPISYDWAISAVVEQLRAFSRDGECHVPIRLVDAPPIDPNTMKLLRLIDNLVAVLG